MVGVGALSGRPIDRRLSHLGRHPQHRLSREPARNRCQQDRLHRQLRRRHPDRLPHGPRRPHRLCRSELLHHLARTPLRHHRPAGRRAEHPRPGRLRHGARRLSDHARPAANADVHRLAGFLRSARLLGDLPRSQRRSTASSATASASPCSNSTTSTASRSRAAKPPCAGCAAGCSASTTLRAKAHSPSSATSELQCTRSGQVLADFKGVSAFGLNLLEAKKYADRAGEVRQAPEKERQAEIRRLLGLSDEIPTAKLLSQKIHYLEDRLSTHKVVYETEKGILIPGLRFKHIQPKGPDRDLPPRRRAAPATANCRHGSIEKYQKNHQEIWVFDLRGLGETAPAQLPRSPAISASMPRRRSWRCT